MAFAFTAVTQRIVPVGHLDGSSERRWLILLLITREPDQPGWNDGPWLFPRAMRLLEVAEYRKQVLAGIVISIGSKTDSTVRSRSMT